MVFNGRTMTGAGDQICANLRPSAVLVFFCVLCGYFTFGLMFAPLRLCVRFFFVRAASNSPLCTFLVWYRLSRTLFIKPI